MGLVLVSPERITIEKFLRLNFLATNNEAEYKDLLKEMVMVQKKGRKNRLKKKKGEKEHKG